MRHVTKRLSRVSITNTPFF
jgi:hypothetical protein